MPLKNTKQRTGEAGNQGVPARAVAGENYILGWTDFFLPVWFGEVSITNSLGGRDHCYCPHCQLLGTATDEPAPLQNTQLLLEASAWYPVSSFHSPLQLDAAIWMSLGHRMWAGMTCSPWLLSSCFPGKGVDTLGEATWQGLPLNLLPAGLWGNPLPPTTSASSHEKSTFTVLCHSKWGSSNILTSLPFNSARNYCSINRWMDI